MILHAERLIDVRHEMCDVVRQAGKYVEFHIRVQEGLRTKERQVQLVAAGASRTMNSRHLTGHAVDLLPEVDIDKDGKLELEELYNWQLSFRVASAMKKASIELNVPLVWGGCWDRQLHQINDPELASADYVVRMRKKNRKPFVDGPHFELYREVYP